MRKHLLSLLSVVVLVSVSVVPSLAQDAASDSTLPYQVHAYNDHLYKLTVLQPFRIDIYASIGPDGVLLVDTGVPQTGDAFAAALRSLTDQPVKLVIATHSHADHIGGIPILAPNAVVVADRNALSSTYFALPPLQLFANPTITVDSSLTLHFNGEDIRVDALPDAHATDEVTVFFTDSKVLCTGSRILPLTFPSVNPNLSGSLVEIMESIPRIVKAYPGVIIAPGHGPDMTGDDAMDYYKSMKKSQKAVEKGLKKGKTEQQLTEENVLGKWIGDTAFTANTAPFWIRAIGRQEGYFPAPQTSVAQPMTEAYMKGGTEAMLRSFAELKRDRPNDFNFAEAQVNLLGYQLLYRNDIDPALAVLKLNMETYPNSANVYDSYGEALLAKGDTTQAISYYEKAAATDSTFVNARNVLQQLRGGN